MKNIPLTKRSILNKLFTLLLALSIIATPFSIYAIGIEETDTTVQIAETDGNVFVSAEETSRRGEFEKHYLLSDGSFAAVSYAEAVHYKNDNGAWEEVDNRLSLNPTTSRFTSNNSKFSASFAESPSSGTLATISSFGTSFSWSLSVNKAGIGLITANATQKATVVEDAEATSRASLSASAEVSPVGKKISDKEAFVSDKISGKLSYEKLFSDAPEIALQYSVYHSKIEEDILITRQTDVKSFSMEVSAPGLTAVLNNSGAVDFVDANGIMQYRVGIPYMEDAAGEVLGNKDILTEINQVGDTCTITYTPDEAWLTASEREYPILLDPSITTKEYNSNIVDTYVAAGDTSNHSSEQKMYYGVRSGKIHRAYIKINNLPNIDASMPIISAKMQLFFTGGTTTGKTAQIYSLDSSWSPSTITYANQPTISADNLIATCPYSSSVMSMTFDLSSDINTLYTDFFAAVNYGYVIKYADESNTNPDYNVFYTTEYTTASKRPVMTINYGYALPSSLTNGEVYSFRNVGSGKYMTVHNGTDANDVNVYQTDYAEGATSQKFKLEYAPSTGGYFLRAMCSSNGAGRVLDLYKINGYVSNGSNLQIYNATDPLAQHWFILGVSYTSFKIIPRTDMSLALTAYGDGNGTSDGRSTSSDGNIFVSTYTSDSYQTWKIYDSNNVALTGGGRILAKETYYINNKSSGKYLHYTATDVDGASGLIADLENTIRWKITPVGENKYAIQSLENMQKYLYAESSNNVGLGNMTSMTDAYLWTLQMADGGGFIVQNVGNQAYLRDYGGVGLSTIFPSSTTPTPDGVEMYSKYIWRLASTEEYGNTYNRTHMEFSPLSTIRNIEGTVNSSHSIVVDDFFEKELWISTEDFLYYFETPDICEYDYSNDTIKILAELTLTKVSATHKPTNRTTTFYVISGFSSTMESTPLADNIVQGLNQPYNVWPAGEDSLYYGWSFAERSLDLVGIRALAEGTCMGGMLATMYNAASFLQHFLDRTGSKYTIDFKDTISEWDKAYDARAIDMNKIMDIVETLATNETQTMITIKAIGHTIADSSDWGRAIGSYTTSVKFTFTKVSSNSFTMNVTYKLHDAYDWDEEIYSMGNMPVSPRQMWELHHGGYAKNFEVYGVNTFTVTWTRGQAFEGATISNEK